MLTIASFLDMLAWEIAGGLMKYCHFRYVYTSIELLHIYLSSAFF